MSKSKSSSETPDWKEVVIEIVLKILTLGFYHVEKHRIASGDEKKS